MKKNYTTEYFQKGVDRLYSQSGKLNLYVQNVNLLDTARVTNELQEISTQVKHLLK